MMDPRNPRFDRLPTPDPILGGHSRPTPRDNVIGTVAGLVFLAAMTVLTAALIAVTIWIGWQVIDRVRDNGISATAAQVAAPDFSLERAMAEAAP